jgi:hypothetical protein
MPEVTNKRENQMIGRKATVGLALLCALLFSALAVQGASAAGTTAYTCVKVPVGEFGDPHCDNGPSGEYEHELIPVEKTTEVTSHNQKTKNETKESTTAVLHAIKAGAQVTITCKKVHGTGSLTNTEEAKVMHAGGTVTVTYSECEVSNPKKCTVKQPIVAEAKSKTWEKGKEMGVEFSPKEAGKPFVNITLEGAECGPKGTFEVLGSVIGTPGGTSEGKGATLYFNASKEEEELFLKQKPITGMQKLTFGGTPALLTSTETVEMKEKEPTTGKAISLTTSL